MAKQPFISHVVNGYSRYDVPESKAFSCTPGILYPARIQFVNARDRVRISQGVDVRSNPFAVPTFNPYTVRLHRFFVPLQLYHPEMRTNASQFDMNDLSLNWLPYKYDASVVGAGDDVLNKFSGVPLQNSLLAWLRIGNRTIYSSSSTYVNNDLPSDSSKSSWVNADTFLAYWDIVRNYYSFSQWSLYSFVWPAAWRMIPAEYSGGDVSKYEFIRFDTDSGIFKQTYGNLQYLDAYFESQFYPNAVRSQNNTYNRLNLAFQIVNSDLIDSTGAISATVASSDGFPVSTRYDYSASASAQYPVAQDELATFEGTTLNFQRYLQMAMPMAVVPSSPDRYSRLLPTGGNDKEVSIPTTTIPQLAVAARLQEYKDLLGAGGNRYSDWLETFFASKIGHVDRPKLLFSTSQTVNVQVVMNQGGQSNLGENPLGQQGGAVAFNAVLGRSQSYYFDEPGYLFDMFSIRPVYYWATITPDYLYYEGADYFNPVYNDIGYQDVPGYQMFSQDLASTSVFESSVAREPIFNEFRASYDEVLGQLNMNHGEYPAGAESKPLYSYWVQQRSLFNYTGLKYSEYFPVLFTDISSVNSPFASSAEDNFFVNLSYSVKVKNLVNKTFVTRLANR